MKAYLAALTLVAGAAPALAAEPAPASAADGEWRMAAHDYANTRFSPLGEITPANLGKLSLAFTFSTGVLRGHEAAPVVADNTMFIVTPYPNLVYALDLTKPGAPQKWKYDPKPRASAQGVACCDVVNRGLVYADGKIFFNTLDTDTIALDAKTGKELWRTRLGSIDKGETVTMAPIVVKGKVLVGNSGGELGVRGWLTALDAETGKIAWRAYSTGPDNEVLIGPSFKPFYAQDRGKNLGKKSWPGDSWKIGGGTVWGFLTYDPETDLIYYGTGNPGPWNPEQRPGDNKWTSGIFARKPDTGEAVWYYQWSPHDLHDYDGVNENVLAEIPIAGKQHKVILHPDRNGYLYALDRASGQVLSASPYATITTSTRVDLQTGKLVYNAAKDPQAGKVVRDICPASSGAKDWQPSSWSPRTKLLYLPMQNICQDAETYETSYISGTPYVGASIRQYAGPGGNRGEFAAWDPVARKKVWSIKENFPVWSGALATAGDVVFYGTMDGWFKGLDGKTGKLLWQYKVGSGIIGQPVSYRGPDGKQYIAVLSGIGGWAGTIVAGEIDPRDGTAATGMINLTKDLPKYTSKGGMLYVFALP